jgi:DNA-binding beta-propeller fold protein YncE
MSKLLTAVGAVMLAGALLPGLGRETGAAGRQPTVTCHNTVYVVDAGNGAVIPVDTVTAKAGPPIALPDGTHDDAGDIVVAGNNAMAYVLNGADDDQSVTPINTATNRAGRAIPASNYGVGPMMWITPDSRRLYVLGANVTLIKLATGRTMVIKFPHSGNGVGLYPGPDGTYLYALAARTLTQIRTETNKPRLVIPLPFAAFGMAVTPNGKTAYVSDWNDDTVIPVSTGNGTLGPPIKVGKQPYQILITPNGRTAYVLNADSDSVTPIATKTNKPGQPIKVPVSYGPGHMMTLTPDGKTLLVLGTRTLTPIAVAGNTAGKPIKIGNDPADIAATGNDQAAWIINQGDGTLVSVRFRAGKVSHPIKVGTDPVALAYRGCPS